MRHPTTRTILVALTLLGSASILPVVADAARGTIDAPATTRSLAGAERLHPPKLSDSNVPVTTRVIELVNAERVQQGLAPLRYDSRLATAAQRHADDQAQRQQMSHTGGDGSSAGDRISRAGYGWRSWSENVALGYSSPAAVVNGWMNSSGHRGNILSANVDTGVGAAVGPDGRIYWTQVFATPG